VLGRAVTDLLAALPAAERADVRRLDGEGEEERMAIRG
jgi:hypothetical protein